MKVKKTVIICTEEKGMLSIDSFGEKLSRQMMRLLVNSLLDELKSNFVLFLRGGD